MDGLGKEHIPPVQNRKQGGSGGVFGGHSPRILGATILIGFKKEEEVRKQRKAPNVSKGGDVTRKPHKPGNNCCKRETKRTDWR